MTGIKFSPIQFTLDIISRKWSIEILECLHSGRKRYSDLLELNDQLSSKVLSERLKDLYELGIIDKIVMNIIPMKAKYQLTKKGELLIPILLEMALFSSLNFPDNIFNQSNDFRNEFYSYFNRTFNLNIEELKYLDQRYDEYFSEKKLDT